jgi:hypothetical protein
VDPEWEPLHSLCIDEQWYDYPMFIGSIDFPSLAWACGCAYRVVITNSSIPLSLRSGPSSSARHRPHRRWRDMDPDRRRSDQHRVRGKRYVPAGAVSSASCLWPQLKPLTRLWYHNRNLLRWDRCDLDPERERGRHYFVRVGCRLVGWPQNRPIPLTYRVCRPLFMLTDHLSSNGQASCLQEAGPGFRMGS